MNSKLKKYLKKYLFLRLMTVKTGGDLHDIHAFAVVAATANGA